MDAEEYKSLCSRPNAFERGVIEASARELSSRHPPLASRLQEVLKGSPVSKPFLHSGDKETDYFLIDLGVAEAEMIVEHLLDSEAGAVGLNGESTSQASRFGSLVDTWTRYIDSCE